MPNPRSERFYPVSPWSFIVLGFVWSCMIHFSWVCCVVWSMNPSSFFCQWMSSCSRTTCWKHRFPPTNSLPLYFLKNEWSVYVYVYFLTLCSSPLISLSIFASIAHFLDYCVFKISLEIRECSPFNFILFLSLAILSPLHFHVTFRIRLSISIK